MTNDIDYTIEEGHCLACGASLEEMEKAGEDAIEHLENHIRKDRSN